MGTNRGSTIAFCHNRWLLFGDGDFRKIEHLSIKN